MKNLLLSCLFSFVLLSADLLFGHCQVPCGIYADQHRFEQMLEDQTTIEKATKLIQELSGKKDAQSQNQLIRWISTKETHADSIQKIIAQYFMTQRLKSADPKYVDKLTKAHSVMVLAMKCKQTADLKNTADLKSAIMNFHKSYEFKK